MNICCKLHPAVVLPCEDEIKKPVSLIFTQFDAILKKVGGYGSNWMVVYGA